MWQYNYTDELYHYGIPGMKWGHRKARPVSTDARSIYRMKKAKAKAEWQAAAKKYGSSNTKEDNYAYDRAADKYISDVKAAKKAYENSRNAATKKSVKAYSKQYDKASSMSDAADVEWAKTKELYKKTGKNRIARILNNMSGKSAEVKAYSKQYDKASNMSDVADAEWKKANDMYKKTGSNHISRVVNNIKYRK